MEETAFVNKRSATKAAPIHIAVQNNDCKMVQMLLDKGANINAVNNAKLTPLFQAVYANHIEIVKVLVRRGANLEASNEENFTPLQVAVARGLDIIVKELLNAGAKVNIYDSIVFVQKFSSTFANSITMRNPSPLCLAIFKKQPKIVRMLLNYGANLNDRISFLNSDLTDILLYIRKLKNVSDVETLFDVNLMDSDNKETLTLLQIAIVMKQFDLVQILLEAGADINSSTSKNAETALHISALCGDDNEYITKLLLFYGAQYDISNDYGEQVLYNAKYAYYILLQNLDSLYTHMEKNEAEKAFDLLQKLEDVKIIAKVKNIENKTLLYLAAREGHLEMVRLLLEGGACYDVETKSKQVLYRFV